MHDVFITRWSQNVERFILMPPYERKLEDLVFELFYLSVSKQFDVFPEHGEQSAMKRSKNWEIFQNKHKRFCLNSCSNRSPTLNLKNASHLCAVPDYIPPSDISFITGSVSVRSVVWSFGVGKECNSQVYYIVLLGPK